jgi:hypothetical protein
MMTDSEQQEWLTAACPRGPSREISGRPPFLSASLLPVTGSFFQILQPASPAEVSYPGNHFCRRRVAKLASAHQLTPKSTV